MPTATIIRGPNTFKVKAPYDEACLKEMRELVPNDKRGFVQPNVWTIDAAYFDEIVATTKRFFPIQFEQVTEVKSRTQLDIAFIARCKEDGWANVMVGKYWSYRIHQDVMEKYFNSEEVGGVETLYSILGVGRSAGAGELKIGKYRAAQVWHPDHNGDADAPEKFQRVIAAYNVLADPDQRRKYDLGLELAALLRADETHIRTMVASGKRKKKNDNYRAPVSCGLMECEIDDGLKPSITRIYALRDDVRTFMGKREVRVAYMKKNKETGDFNLVTEWQELKW